MLSDNKVIEIIYMADDFCKFFNETVKKHSIDDEKKHRNKPSRLSDAEMITILIMFHIGGYKCLKHFYINYICRHCKHLFPKTVSYNRFVELEKKVAAKEGGEVAKIAREQLESKIGKSVISSKNAKDIIHLPDK